MVQGRRVGVGRNVEGLRDAQAIVLDANQRSALAVTRSLGRVGIRVATADCTNPTLSGRSKYSHSQLAYPDPAQELSAFITALGAMGSTSQRQVLLPCSDETLPLILGADALRQKFATCVPTANAYHQLSDKWAMYQIAKVNGIPVPITWRLPPGAKTAADVLACSERVVVKPRQSVLNIDGNRRKLPVVVLNKSELAALLTGGVFPEQADLLVQEAVPGRGVGVSVVCNRGSVVAWFAHQRLREKPPAGGVSVYCESIALDPRLRRYCETLIDATSWHGPAMFEFKVDATGAASLIEVNGRLWGSVQLAIDCGVDVPQIVYRIARGEAVEQTSGYAIGRKLRWLVGDLSHLYLVLRGKGVDDQTPSAWRTALSLLGSFGPGTRIEDWRYGDFGPLWHQLRRELSPY